MKIALKDCPMVVSNRLKFLHSKYKDVKIVLGGSAGKGTHLYATYTDWKGKKREDVIGTF